MAEDINLNKEVFNKRAYLKSIDTSFKELGVKTTQEQIDAQPTVQEFFDMYNTLFYNINELGPTNSHEYLIRTSSEYVGDEITNSIIELLQAEIASLRTLLLDQQKQMGDLAKSVGAVDENGNPISFEDPIEAAGLSDVNEALSDVSSNTSDLVSTGDRGDDPRVKRVLNDYKRYPDASLNKRSKRTNLSKSFILGVKNEYKL